MKFIMKIILKKFVITLLSCLFPIFLLASQDTISGYVVDTVGNPISYVSVYLKSHPASGVASDGNGKFSLIIDRNKFLADDVIFSFIGMKTLEIPVSKLLSAEYWKIVMKEQPILLDNVIVSRKISKKETKKLKISALKNFEKQLLKDFPNRNTSYPVVSIYFGGQDNRQLAKHEIIGFVDEYFKDYSDSINVRVSKIKENFSLEIDSAYSLLDQIATEKSKKSKKMKYNSRTIDERALKMHKFLWGGYTGNILDLINTDKLNRWSYVLVGDDGVLSYTDKTNYLGIVKMELNIDFYVNPSNFQIRKIAQSMVGEAHIPFGYKLSKEELQLINTLQIGVDTLDKYKVRHLYGDVKRNVIFQNVDGKMFIKEKNLKVKGTIVDNKKRKLNYNADAKVNVVGTPIIF